MDGARYQVSFDPDKATFPISFAIQKISEGTTYKDTALDELWEGVKKLDIRGGYHYLRSGMSWGAQVNNYLTGIKSHNIHSLDLEGYGNTYSNTFFADAYRWINQVRQDTGQPVALYTNGSTYTLFVMALEYLLGKTISQNWLDNLDLWIAYPSTTASAPPLQYKRENARKQWTFWQDNWNCTGCGCAVASDHDFFNGTLQELYEWAGVVPPPTDPGEPPVTTKTLYFGYTKEPTKVFEGPKVNQIPPDIPANTYVEGETAPVPAAASSNPVWLLIYKPRIGYINIGSLTELKTKIVTVPDPEPPPTPGLPVIHYERTETFRAQGYPDKTVTTSFDWTPNA